MSSVYLIFGGFRFFIVIPQNVGQVFQPAHVFCVQNRLENWSERDGKTPGDMGRLENLPYLGTENARARTSAIAPIRLGLSSSVEGVIET
jgi:hypothetical protein